MSSSRFESVVLALREQIISGKVGPGTKVSEVGTAERLGVSRTPVRLALQALESEGLVTGTPNRGFIVRRITPHYVSSGFDVRGTLEGFACRLLAERGLPDATDRQLHSCIERGDEICSLDVLDEDAVRAWTDINIEFHTIILEAADNLPLVEAHKLVCRNPLVGPASLAFSSARLVADTPIIAASQRHHRMIWEALQNGESSRAEFLAREHIHRAKVSTEKNLSAYPFGDGLQSRGGGSGRADGNNR